MTTALLFPGQGSQSPSMRESVARHAPELLDAARDLVGDDPFERIADGTAYVQPAVYCASLAGWSRLGSPEPELAAGHSLGEFGALVAAGSLDLIDGLRLVALRGRLMQAAADVDPGGGMVALRAPLERARAIAAGAGLVVANDNAPDQVVLSGTAAALEAGEQAALEAGLRAKRLAVSGAFHSPAVDCAVPTFAAALGEVELRPPRGAVICGATARPFDDLRRRLAKGVTSPVRWRETLLALRDRGARRFLETGPGRVLAGLTRRTLGDVPVESADAPEPARA